MKKPPQPSLLTRIVLRLTATTLIAIVLAYGGLWWEFKSTTGAVRDKSLIDAARTIAQSVEIDASGRLTVNLPAGHLRAYAESGDTHGFSVRDRDSGEILFAVGAATGPFPEKLDEDEDGSLYQYDPDGPGPLAFFGEAFPFTADHRQLVVQVVRLGSNYEALIETVLADAFDDGGWLAGPFLLVLLLVSIVTVRSTLAPLRDLSRQAEAINPQAADLRLPVDGVPCEILPLVLAVNSALDRLEEGFRVQRDFTADAAHELRTPLAVLTAHIDTLPDRQVAASLRRDVDTMSHLVEQLLRIAHAEALVIEPEDSADLCAIARDVAAYLAPMAIRDGRTLEVDAPENPVYVNGQTGALFHAVRNLADNALRYSARGDAVLLTVSADPPVLEVRDHGPGVPAALREKIFQRFWRSDRRTGGAGLGLAIVTRTMKTHGGDVTIHDAEGGGALFRMEFPSDHPTAA